MSYTVFEACLEPERRRCGAAELSTLLALAAHVNQKDTERGWEWLAWPSQALLAGELGLSDRQLRRKLTCLKEVGDIRETGEIKGRGIKVFEITLRPRSEDVSSVDEADPPSEDRSDPTRVDETDRGRIRPADRTDPVTTPDIFGHDPGRIRPPEPGEPNEPELKPEVTRAPAREATPAVDGRYDEEVKAAEVPSPLVRNQILAEHRGLCSDLELLEKQHREKPRDRTQRAITDQRSELERFEAEHRDLFEVAA
jgi:hypothetical protein